MALVVMCGQPCSGKSSAAAALIGALGKSSSAMPVSLIDEPSLNLDRNDAFRDVPSEKNLRGLLRSAVDRTISKDTIVIIDSLNHIKGYRYELWCLARAEGTRYCIVSLKLPLAESNSTLRTYYDEILVSYRSNTLVTPAALRWHQYESCQLHCDAGKEDCRIWNKARQQEGFPSYENHIFDDLVTRFERPDGKNRWDAPLFELKPAIEQIQESSEAIVEAVAYLTGAQSSRNSRALQPTVATKNIRPSDTNVLYELDHATQEVITAVIEAQIQGAGGVVRSVALGTGIPDVSLQRSVGLPELRRHRRTFIKLAGQTSLSGPPPPSDAQSVKRMFATYLNGELSSN